MAASVVLDAAMSAEAAVATAAGLRSDPPPGGPRGAAQSCGATRRAPRHTARPAPARFPRPRFDARRIVPAAAPMRRLAASRHRARQAPTQFRARHALRGRPPPRPESGADRRAAAEPWPERRRPRRRVENDSPRLAALACVAAADARAGGASRSRAMARIDRSTRPRSAAGHGGRRSWRRPRRRRRAPLSTARTRRRRRRRQGRRRMSRGRPCRSSAGICRPFWGSPRTRTTTRRRKYRV